MRTHYSVWLWVAEIHCLKAGEVATLTAPAITDDTCKLLQEDESTEEDPFAILDEGNKGELEQNKLLIDADSNQNYKFLHNSYPMLC